MGENKQPAAGYDEADGIKKQPTAHRSGTGIGGGLVGAAIGGLIGRRVGGVSGGVVGAVAGALVGRGTAVRVNRTVESLVDAAKSVAETVNQNVNGVGDALKDTVDGVKPSVVSVVDSVKDTVEEVKPSVLDVVDAAKSVAFGVNHSVNGVGDAVKDTVDRVKPSVISVVDTVKDTVEQVKSPIVDTAKSVAEAVNRTVVGIDDSAKGTGDVELPSDAAKRQATTWHPNSNLSEEQVIKMLLRKSQEHPVSNHVKEQAPPKKSQKVTPIIAGIIVGVATITLMSVMGFSAKNQQETKLRSNQSLSPTRPKTADGWVFIGNTNNASHSALVAKPLIEGSQSTDSPVVPSVGSIVTVTVRPGVTLRKNPPQQPDFNYKRQKALAVLQPREKLKISKVGFVPLLNTTRPGSQVWVQVQRCGSACN